MLIFLRDFLSKILNQVLSTLAEWANIKKAVFTHSLLYFQFNSLLKLRNVIIKECVAVTVSNRDLKILDKNIIVIERINLGCIDDI